MTIRPGTKIAVHESAIHGRGVFATEPLSIGDVIETCPVLRVPKDQMDLIDSTLLFEYYYIWNGDVGVALGFGSLYNNSATPNAEYIKVTANDTLVIRALTPIATGDEITISYSHPGQE